eukprot:9510244-Lingulodinium_polyedra.AAC.1
MVQLEIIAQIVQNNCHHQHDEDIVAAQTLAAFLPTPALQRDPVPVMGGPLPRNNHAVYHTTIRHTKIIVDSPGVEI